MKNWKAIVTKVNSDEPPYISYFETEQEGWDWIESYHKNRVGRRPERVVQEPVLDGEGNPTYSEVPRVDEQGNPVYRVEYQYDDEGMPIEGSEVVTDEQIIDQVPIMQDVTLPAEATYDVIDNSVEAAREERLKDLQTQAAKNKADLDFGQMIIALVGMKNEAKGLTHEQKNTMMSDSTIQTILAMLQAGRIGYSKQLVTSFIPDGTLFTKADKNEVLQLIDDHLAKWS